MPKLTQTDTWVREYRDLLRQSMEEHHQWSVGEHNGSIRLQVKDNGKKQTRLLPFEWSKKGFSSDDHNRVMNSPPITHEYLIHLKTYVENQENF